MPSSKIQYTSLDPQVLGGMAQEETSQEIKNDVKSLYNTIGSTENSDNSLYGKIDNILQKTNQQLSLLNGESSPFGTAYMGDIEITDSSKFSFPTNDSYGRCVIQCGNFTLNEGVTLKAPKCTGLYIFATGDITINGKLISNDNNIYGSTYFKEMVDYIEINGKKYYLAKGGVSRGYNGSIKIGSSSIKIYNRYNSSFNGATSNYGSGSLTINDASLSSVNENICNAPHISGGNYIKNRSISITSGYFTVYSSDSGSRYDRTDSEIASISSSNSFGNASIILISKNNIYINDTIDTSGGPVSMNVSPINDYQSYHYYSAEYDRSYTVGKFANALNGKIVSSLSPGGVTLISSNIDINGSILTHCAPISVEAVSTPSKTLEETITMIDKDNGGYYNTSGNARTEFQGTTGEYSITADSIVPISGEIKVYEFGGEL